MYLIQKKELDAILIQSQCNESLSLTTEFSVGQLNCSTESLDSSLCWETMIGQVIISLHMDVGRKCY